MAETLTAVPIRHRFSRQTGTSKKGECDFQAFPPEIIFRNYEAYESYEMTLLLRNNDKVARTIRIEPPNSTIFIVTSKASPDKKIAAGMDAAVTVKFTPTDFRTDYHDVITCITEKGTFTVPINTIGARGFIDIPNEIKFEATAVKCTRKIAITVRNKGNNTSNFSLTTNPSNIFKVSPAACLLDIGESQRIELTFIPQQVEEYNGELTISYETGETTQSKLIGISGEVPVGLEKDKIEALSCYINDTSQTKFKIVNNSDFKVSFSWCNSEDSISPPPSRNSNRNLFPDAFQNEFFGISPLKGEIWPSSSFECSVTFSPKFEQLYNATAYLNVNGREARLPLTLEGQGLGPLATFSPPVNQIGNVYVNSKQKHSIRIANTGAIELSFKLGKCNHPIESAFKFEPFFGTIAVGESVDIEVEFSPLLLGAFNAAFEWLLEGSSKPVITEFRGTVLGPTCLVDIQKVDFGICSYGFTTTRSMRITNTSEIYLRYKTRVVCDNSESSGEFLCSPASGEIKAFQSGFVRVNFTPLSSKKYSANLYLDIEHVGERVAVIPMTAEALVPIVALASQRLDFGEIFIHHPYEQVLTLHNDTDQPARYEMVHQEDQSSATYSLEEEDGIIEAYSLKNVKTIFTSNKLGPVNIPMFLRIKGSPHPPLQLTLSAVSMGPNVILDYKKEKINFGRVQVLSKHDRKVKLINDSLIPASFTVDIKKKKTFSLDIESGIIEPKGSVTLTLSALFEDTVIMNSKLKIFIKEGGTFELEIVGQGEGSTIMALQDIKQVDFGIKPTNQTCEKSFTLENKGQRVQLIIWSNFKMKKNKKITNKEEEEEVYFKVFPESAILEPGAQQEFSFKGISSHSARVSETLLCSGMVDKIASPLFECQVSCKFENPLLEYPAKISFAWEYDPEKSDKPGRQFQPLPIKNVSAFPLHFLIKCSPPFSVMISDFELEPGALLTTRVQFEPEYTNDKQSRLVEGTIIITCNNHPQKESIKLTGRVSYPNLAFDQKKIDFGTINNNNEKRQWLTISNNGALPVNYHWTFVSHDKEHDGIINQVFDILPVYGSLEPGENEKAEFTFYAKMDRSFSATAICNVDGGPFYEFLVTGESSSIQYKLDKRILEFGILPYESTVSKEVLLSNLGKVPFSYYINTKNHSRCILVTPSSGIIAPNGKTKLKVHFRPGIPERIEGEIFVEIEQLSGEGISFFGEGVFHHVTFTLPRVPHADFQKYLDEYRKKNGQIENIEPSLAKYTKGPSSNSSQGTIRMQRDLRQVDFEVEAERMLIKDFVKRQEELEISAPINYEEPLQVVEVTTEGEEIRASSPENPKFPKTLILSQYICNFGNVVKGKSPRMKFDVMNRGFLSISFIIPKLRGTPFFVEPDRVKDLPGFPNHGTATFKVHCRADDEDVKLGPVEVKLPIQIKGGSTYELILKANIVVPEVTINSEKVDFGRILLGQCKIITIQLCNNKEAKCDWSIGYGVAAKSSKDSSAFAITPTSGSLAPGAKVNVKITFYPSQERKYSFNIPVKVASNPHQRLIMCRGEAIGYEVVFEPTTVQLGPTLPLCREDATVVQMHNKSSIPVEIYSLDFDTRWIEEEEVLRNSDIFNEDGVAMLPPREPGQPVLPVLDPSTKIEEPKIIVEPIVLNPVPAFPLVKNIILMGASLSGKTVLAQRIAKTKNLYLFQIEEVISNFMHSNEDIINKHLRSTPDTKEESHTLPQDLLVEIFTNRLKSSDCENGIVVDGLHTQFASQEQIAQALQHAFESLGRSPQVVFLRADVNNIKERKAQEFYSEEHKIMQKLKELLSIPEELYDSMNPQQQIEFEEAKKEIKNQKREIQDRRKKIIQMFMKPKDRINSAVYPEKGKSFASVKRQPNKKSTVLTGSPSKGTTNARRDKRKQEREDTESQNDSEESTISENEYLTQFAEKLISQYKQYAMAVAAIFDADKEKSKPKKTKGKKAKTDSLAVETPRRATSAYQVSSVNVEPAVPKVEEEPSPENIKSKNILFANCGQSTDAVYDEITIPLFGPPVEIKEEPKELVVTEEKLQFLEIPSPVTYRIITRPQSKKMVSPPSQFHIWTPKSLEDLLPIDISESMGSIDESAQSNLPRIASEISLGLSTSGSAESVKEIDKKRPRRRIRRDGDKVDIEVSFGDFLGSTSIRRANSTKETRWILPPNSSKHIVVTFVGDSPKISQPLQFGIVGSQKILTLPCVGATTFPAIISDLSHVFSNKIIKVRGTTALIKKQVVASSKTFDFGAILAGKSREGYLDYKHPENYEKLKITNGSSLDVEIDFQFQRDSTQLTFLLSPSSMKLKPKETQDLTVWAYPKAVGVVEDTIICLIKDNPEPVTFPITCTGAKPSLEIDKSVIDFGKLLLRTKDTQYLTLVNRSSLPSVWKISGGESIPDLIISPTSGVIDPLQMTRVSLSFEANNAGVWNKKILKLDVTDVGNILNQPNPITVMVNVEAYNVAVDLNFPKGSGTSLQFGVIKVGEDSKQMLTLKNKGKYGIAYRFQVSNPKIFTVTPSDGVVSPGDKQVQIAVTFKTSTEIDLRDSKEMYFQMFDSYKEELIAKIPVTVNARAVFSKYKFDPERGINFGPFQSGAKKTRTLTIRNEGEFDFKFNLYKPGEDQTVKELQEVHSNPSITENTIVNKKAQSNKKKNVKKGESLIVGDYTLSPSSGVVSAGGSMKINVEYSAENGGTSLETVLIDVTDRDPKDFPEGIPYELLGESCIPGIITNDFNSIFEEQQVAPRLEIGKITADTYAIHERVFFFSAIILGQSMENKIKISNASKVPCTVNFGIATRKGVKEEIVFDVKPKRLSIPPQDHVFVSIVFNPTAVRSYSAIFEASVLNGTDSKTNKLTFELRGEATLPQVSILQPIVKTKSGFPLLKFKRLLIGKSQVLPVVLLNDGTIPANVKLEMPLSKAFSISQSDRWVTIESKQSFTYEITFQPNEIKQYSIDPKLRIQNNPFENTSLAIQGEGYSSEITIENLPEDADDELNFGETFVNVPKQVQFTLINHGSSPIRFEWKAASSEFYFGPPVGHVSGQSNKTIKAVFRSAEPRQHKNIAITCKIQKIKYSTENLMGIDWEMRKDPEPAFKVIEELSPMSLKAVSISDYSKYECATSNVLFKSTPMFQTRSFTFPFKNSGSVAFECSWDILDNDLFEEEAPFSISPGKFKLPSGETKLITVTFSPKDAGEYCYKLVPNVPYLHSSIRPAVIELIASSVRPLCHFELEDSDYLSGGRRNPEMRGPDGRLGALDPRSRVIEMRSCGVKVKNTKRFHIVNPTNLSYEFVWECLDPIKNQITVFHCNTKNGLVYSGKKFEMVFEYLPQDLGLQESFWVFKIPQHAIEIPFVLVGHADEPEVFLDKTHLNYNAVLIGKKLQEVVYLINKERIPFTFKLSRGSIGDEKWLEASPMKGEIAPESQLPITIAFTPNLEKKFTSNIALNISRKPTPLSLNIKGEGYAIQDALKMESETGQIDLSSATRNVVNFGHVQINDKRIKVIIISNNGKFPFDFQWKFQKEPYLTITPDKGTVVKGESIQCSLVYAPKKISEIIDIKFACNITNGHKYVLGVNGKAFEPKLDFNFLQCDFGACFLWKPGKSPVERILTITNKEQNNEVSIDCLYKNSPHVEIQASPTVLQPKKSVDFKILFYPKAETKYRELVPFDINGLHTVNVEVLGEGIRVKVGLAKEEQQSSDFGPVRVGQKATVTVPIINRSRKSASVSLVTGKLDKLGVTVQPTEVALKPKETANFIFTFEPKFRIPVFSEEVQMEVEGTAQTLLFLSGSGQGTELKLESEIMSFPPVVQNGMSVQRMKLRNIGDVPTKFKWDESKFSPDFTISPVEGVVASSTDVSLKVTFAPSKVNPDIRYVKLPCHVEGGQALHLTLVGSCISQPEGEVIHFKTPVRKPIIRAVTITNNTGSHWKLTPQFDNEIFSGSVKELKVGPAQAVNFDITYYPLTMTLDKSEHRGTLFFALPDGQMLVYQLIGNSLPPLPVSNVNRSIPCKSQIVQQLAVKNWLKEPQRFKVTIDYDKDPALTIKGLDYIDVPGLGERQYKLTFFSFKEGNYNIKVTFTNEKKEFMYYLISFSTSPPEVLKVIELETPVRRSIAHTLAVHNPLDIAAHFSLTCDNSEMSFANTLVVQPGQEGNIEVTYLPLLLLEAVARLTLTSPQLGIYIYEFRLRSTSPGPEKPLHFKVGLGARQIQTFRFIHFARAKTEYLCKVDHPEFSVDKLIVAPSAPSGGIEVAVDVVYEPSKLGDVSTILTAVSNEGGEFTCSLYGHCTPPQPQGPINLKGGTPATITVYNPFTKGSQFYVNVDNSTNFVIKPTEIFIPSKKSSTISISYKNSSSGITAGKITITSEDSTAPWIVYLKGSN